MGKKPAGARRSAAAGADAPQSAGRSAPVRALSREEPELMIAANNGHLLSFDNLSGLPAWLSDALCAVRQLYTDDEEVLFKASRPTLLRDRGHWSAGFGRPRDFSKLGVDWRGAAAFQNRALAGIRAR
jgi:hypothetical protein